MFDDEEIVDNENIIVFDKDEDAYYEEIESKEENDVTGGASVVYKRSTYYSREISVARPRSGSKLRPTLAVSFNGGPAYNVRQGEWVDGWYFTSNGNCSKVIVKHAAGRLVRTDTVRLYWGLADGATQYLATLKITL